MCVSCLFLLFSIQFYLNFRKDTVAGDRIKLIDEVIVIAEGKEKEVCTLTLTFSYHKIRYGVL